MGVAFVFPGSNTYQVGMAHDLYGLYETVRRRFREANEALGYDLASIVFHGPNELLSRISIMQPAIVTYGVAVMDLFMEAGIRPVAMAGHSLGEFTALTGAGVISFRDAIKSVALRGALIEQVAPKGCGSMMAIEGASQSDVQSWCERAQSSGHIQLANRNAPAQFVVSGHHAALDEVKKLASVRSDCRCTPLAVDYPFHSDLLRAVEQPLAQFLKDIEFRNASYPVISNRNGEAIWRGSEWRHSLLQQLCGAVHWEKSVRRILRYDATTFVEMGPGRVVRGLIRRIAPDVEVMNTNNADAVSFSLKRLARESIFTTQPLETACAI
jgi:[acyl-carrier-protein] S-malonyltransferase